MQKVSIITTTYKHQDFIAQTIESVLAQTYTDWELLIWDDSPDAITRNIIQQYVQRHPDKITAWHHAPNKWIVANLNFLISQISSESNYIAFLEWDDFYTSDNLEKKIAIFNEYPDVKLVYNNLDFIDKNNKVFFTNFLRKAPFYLRNESLSKELFIKHETFYGSYSTLMIEKKILEEIPIRNITNDKLFGVSDRDLFFRICTKYNCYWLSESLTLYRRHAWNLSWQYIKLFDDLTKQIEEYRETGFITEKLFAKKLAFIHLLKSVSYLEKGERKKSLEALLKSTRLDPFANMVRKIWVLGLNIMPKQIIDLVLKRVIKR